MRSEFKTFKSIVASTITIGIATGILYTSGIFQDAGFLETLNIESSLFPKSLEDTIFTGGITLFSNNLTKLLNMALFLLVPFFVFSILFEVKDSQLISGIFNKNNTPPAQQSERDKFFQELKAKSLSCFVFAIALILSISAAVFILTSSLNSGTSDALKILSLQTDNPKKYNSKITFNDKSSIEGYIIRCSSTACAMLNNSTVTIFQLSETSRIQKTITK